VGFELVVVVAAWRQWRALAAATPSFGRAKVHSVGMHLIGIRSSGARCWRTGGGYGSDRGGHGAARGEASLARQLVNCRTQSRLWPSLRRLADKLGGWWGGCLTAVRCRLRAVLGWWKRLTASTRSSRCPSAFHLSPLIIHAQFWRIKFHSRAACLGACLAPCSRRLPAERPLAPRNKTWPAKIAGPCSDPHPH
jgi:hypothetical protein